MTPSRRALAIAVVLAALAVLGYAALGYWIVDAMSEPFVPPPSAPPAPPARGSHPVFWIEH
jgi:hypothetical protein